MVRILDSFKYGVFAAALAFGAVGCDDETTTPAGPTSLTVKVGAATTTALAGKKFTFAGGVKGFKTTASTDVTFTSSSAATIVSGGKTATAMVRYGSCIFTIACTPAANCPGMLANGDMVTIEPCVAALDEQTGSGTLTFGSDKSASTMVGTVDVSCMGTTCTVTVNGNMAGSATTTGSIGG